VRTPGPWKSSPHYGEWLVWSEENKKKPSSKSFPYIAMVYNESNVSLVCAAPELLKICKELVAEEQLSSKWLEKIKKVVSEAERGLE